MNKFPLGLGLGLMSRRTIGDLLPSFALSVTGLTANPTHGTTAQDGVLLTAVASDTGDGLPGDLAYIWTVDGVDQPAGATFTPDASVNDLDSVQVRATGTGYSTRTSPTYTIRYAPPTAAGALADVSYVINTGVRTEPSAGDFTGAALVYSVSTVTGVTIDPATGVRSFDTDAMTEQTGTSVVVTATNSGGSVSSGFSLAITAAVTPEITNAAAGTQTATTQPITFDITLAATVDWVLTTSATSPTPTQVVAGQDHTGAAASDTGSFAVSSGSPSVNVTITPGLDGSGFYLHLSPINGGQRSTDVDTVGPLTLDTVAPVLSSPASSNLGSTTADGSVTSDEASGTLYAGVWPTASTPSAADIKAGTGAIYHTTDASVTAGANAFSATGLTDGTAYKWHFHQEDAKGNGSNIATTAEFSTTAGFTDILAPYGQFDVSGDWNSQGTGWSISGGQAISDGTQAGTSNLTRFGTTNVNSVAGDIDVYANIAAIGGTNGNLAFRFFDGASTKQVLLFTTDAVPGSLRFIGTMNVAARTNGQPYVQAAPGMTVTIDEVQFRQ